MKYFHGSSIELPIGTIMSGQGDAYEKNWGNTDFYRILEKYRPQECLAHKFAVFMVGHADDIDLAGGGVEWGFEVDPIGNVSKHDMNWSSEISMLLSEGISDCDPRIILAAESYWSGRPHYNESVWEYIAPQAVITRCEPYEDFEVESFSLKP